jgi:tryptophan synthase beta chain
VHYAAVRDEAAINAFTQLSLSEGIIPALESAHALAYATKLARRTKRNGLIVVTLSGRGDKDVQVVAETMGDEI